MLNSQDFEQKQENIEVIEAKILNQELKLQIEDSFYVFVIEAFKVLHNGEELNDNWHIGHLCDKLQYQTYRIKNRIPKEKDIIINVPPRSLKSFIVSVCWPAWSWIHMPSLKFIGSSYSSSLSIEHNVLCRRLIESEWYQSYWGNKVNLTTDQNTKGNFENDMSGFRKATSTGGAITGKGGDVISCDDPTDPSRAMSEIERKNAIDYFTQTLSTRLNDQNIGLFLIIMQRLHEEDLTGYLLSNMPENYEHICLPGELDGAEVSPPELKEHYENGLLFPSRFSRGILDKYKKSLGAQGYAGQILQKPSPESGNMIKKDWWRFYEILPEKFDRIVQSWDAAFKGEDTSDYVVGQIWGILGPKRYLIDQFRGRVDYINTKKQIKGMLRKYPESNTILIEEKANGAALINDLKRDISGIIAIVPKESKISRLNAVSGTIEAGDVYLPSPKIASWISEYITEFSFFPRGKHDDQVDATTQFLNYIATKKIGFMAL